MTTKEFISILSQYNPDAEVIVSSDSEGNEFSPVDDVNQVLFSPEGQGDVYNMQKKNGIKGNLIDAIVIYPLDSYASRRWRQTQLNQK